MPLTLSLSRRMANTGFSGLPPAGIEMVKVAVRDFFACALAGSRTAVADQLWRYARRYESTGPAPVIGRPGVRLSLPAAAWLNGTLGHALDYDDVNPVAVAHTSVALVPALIALAEVRRVSGRDLITAYAVGFELIVKLARRLNPAHYEHGWHTTLTLGALGAAAGSAKILRLSPEQFCHALGIASAFAAGSRRNFGTMTKPLHAGNAARAGVTAALLAADGFTADPDILAADYGLGRLFSPGRPVELKPILHSWGRPWELVASGIAIKKYPCCAGNHSSLDAMLELAREQNLKPDAVKSATCQVPALVQGILHRHRPRNAGEARFSLEFAMAVAIIERAAGLDQYTDRRVRDPRVQRMMRRVHLQELSSSVQKRLAGGGLHGARILVELNGGQKLVAEAGPARGNPGAPLSEAEHWSKFQECAHGVLPAPTAEKLFTAFGRLELSSDVTKFAIN